MIKSKKSSICLSKIVKLLHELYPRTESIPITMVKQSLELLDYLESVPGKHLTVAEICDHFKGM